MNELITVLLSSVKFAMTFPLAILEFKFSFFETILWINLGGILGIYFFAYLWEGLLRLIERFILRRKRKKEIEEEPRKKKKVFRKRNRRIIRIKQKYGLIGIALATPFLLSIPLGVFLAVRYYPRSKSKYFYLIGSNIVWSIVYTSFIMFWNDLLFK